MKRTLLQTLVLGLTVAGLSAGDLPADIQAKFIKILATNAGSAGKVACKDPGVAAALGGARRPSARPV